MKNIKLVFFEIWGTSNGYCVMSTYRNKLLFSFIGKDKKELINKAHIWASNQGYTIKN